MFMPPTGSTAGCAASTPPPAPSRRSPEPARPEYSGDGGPASRAGLAEPNGLAFDPDETHLYIADVADHRVRVVDLASGVIDTFAGTGMAEHGGDGGPAREARIFGARAVKVAPDGTVYILERQGSSLRAVDPATGLSTRSPAPTGRGYSGDGGPAASAVFDAPKEMALDRDGSLLIVDTENHAIRRIDRASGIVTTVVGGSQGGHGDGGPAALPGSTARMAPWSVRTARSISATRTITASARSCARLTVPSSDDPAPARGGLRRHCAGR